MNAEEGTKSRPKMRKPEVPDDVEITLQKNDMGKKRRTRLHFIVVVASEQIYKILPSLLVDHDASVVPEISTRLAASWRKPWLLIYYLVDNSYQSARFLYLVSCRSKVGISQPQSRARINKNRRIR